LIGSGTHTLHHPQVGPLTLHYEKFQPAGAHDQTLVVYHPAPGSEQALRLLAIQRSSPAAD
jgi:MmyB-like transcription regulator ligand binding domain